MVAVNHASHDFPGADVVFSKDLGMWAEQANCPTCCVDLPTRTSSRCVYSTSGDQREWSELLPQLEVIPEQQRRAGGHMGRWPRHIEEGLVTCGNSGIGALCLADVLTGGCGTLRVWGLDFDVRPYSTWAEWFRAAGFTEAVRSRVVVHGECALDPRGLWGRA